MNKSVILIADAGATKVDWCKIGEDGMITKITTSGINPACMSDDDIFAVIESAKDDFFKSLITSELYYYGAGVSTDVLSFRLKQLLKKVMPNIAISVKSDMLGAAKALCGDNSGIACILGTGSNSCLYDGSKIVAQTPSLGWILGDEGSGNALGRRFLSDIYKGVADQWLKDEFEAEYGITVSDIIERTYRGSSPNAYVASFVPFIHKNIGRSEYLHDMCVDEFCRFIRRNPASYKYPEKILNFCGSIAYNFEDLLREACEKEGYEINLILKNPMEGLIKYHKKVVA